MTRKNSLQKNRAASPAMGPRAQKLPPWLGGLLMVAAALIVYWPSLGAAFIWDDDAHITTNPCVVGPLGIWEIWTTSAARICPLVLSSFWLEHKIFGLNPMPYHLVNILVHAAGGVVLWRVLLTLRVRAAWLGAMLWVLHPVQVESVAWVTELKNTQSGLFFLLSILFYARMLRAQQDWTGDGQAPRWRRDYALVLLFGALGMASKTSVVVLPVVLGLISWWFDGKWQWKRVKWLVPLLLMSLAAGILALWTQHLEGANNTAWARSVPERIIVAGCVVWFYLGKLLWPQPLMFIYPRWEIDAGSLLWWLPLLGLVLMFGLLWRWRSLPWVRAVLFSLVYFVVALVPVLGLADHYFIRYSFVGDHFQYLASMGPLALAGAGLKTLLEEILKQRRQVFAAAAGLLLTVLGILSWRQCRVYQDEETLWLDTLKLNPRCWMALNNLGVISNKRGDTDAAWKHWQASLEFNPTNVSIHNNLGYGMMQAGRQQEAFAHYSDALKIDPAHADANYNMGNYYLANGQAQQAMDYYQKAVAGSARFAPAYNNLGNASLMLGLDAEALGYYQKAVEIQPDDPAYLNNLSWVLATSPDKSLRNGTLAVEMAEKALSLSKQTAVQLLRSLAAAQAEAGNFDEAAATATKAAQQALAEEKFSTAAQLSDEAEQYRNHRAL